MNYAKKKKNHCIAKKKKNHCSSEVIFSLNAVYVFNSADEKKDNAINTVRRHYDVTSC